MPLVELSKGFHLNVECKGDGQPLVLLHGFTGSSRAWGDFGERLVGSFKVVTVDIVGHGQSDSPPGLDHYLMSQARRDIVSAVQGAGVERAHWLGYSMGGRTALHVAAAFPEAVDRLMLVGASPGIAERPGRQARIASDAALADDIERYGVPAFVDRWENLALFATQKRLPDSVRAAIRGVRLANNPRGLAQSLRWMGAGSQPRLHEVLPSVSMPTLLLAGAEDSKYVEQGRQMAAAMPSATFVSVPGVGHAAHTEEPQFCANEVVRFSAGEASK